MNIYVGNLSWSMTDDDLSNLFSQYGTVTSAKILKEKNTGRSKGFGFVEMEDDEAAKTAIATLNESEVQGRKLIVNESQPRPEGGGGGTRKAAAVATAAAEAAAAVMAAAVAEAAAVAMVVAAAAAVATRKVVAVATAAEAEVAAAAVTIKIINYYFINFFKSFSLIWKGFFLPNAKKNKKLCGALHSQLIADYLN